MAEESIRDLHWRLVNKPSQWYAAFTKSPTNEIARIMLKQIAEADAATIKAQAERIAELEERWNSISPAPPCCECSRLKARIRELEALIPKINECCSEVK